jgi:hypothetical protein
MVPLRMHPAFFSLVRGESLPLTYLASKSSHMMGAIGEPVASLFSILPQLEEYHLVSKDGSKTKEEISQLESCIFDKEYDFTSNMKLRDWLDFYWVDPITKSPLPTTSSSSSSSSKLGQINATEKEEEINGESTLGSSSSSNSNNNNNNNMVDSWNREVTPSTLLVFLQEVGDRWVGKGVEAQVNAFRQGLGDLISLEGGLLSFEARELRDLFCGPDSIDWTEESLLKILRPTGGFTQDEDTIKWLRAELVSVFVCE